MRRIAAAVASLCCLFGLAMDVYAQSQVYDPPAAAAAAAEAGQANPGGRQVPQAPAANPYDSTPAAPSVFQPPPSRPLNLPAVEYLLIGPPHGVFESECPNAYRQVVGPCEEPSGDPCFDHLGIDIFRPDGLAPIGVIGDHTLSAIGQVLISYRYNRNAFDDNRVGTGRVSNADVLAAFPFAPTHMVTETHRFLIEYAPTQDLTLLGQLPFQHVNIDYVDAAGQSHETDVTDPGDISLTALYVLKRWDRQQIHLNFGLSFPTAVLRSERTPPTPTSLDFSYPMRVGSGTYDLLPGLTYRGQSDWWTWGGQALGIVRMGRNNAGYQLGDQVDLTAWLSRRLNDSVSTSARVNGSIWGNIRGADPLLNPALVPLNRPDLRGGERVDLLFGVNYCLRGLFAGQRIGVEAGLPVYQHLDGPQPSLQWILHAGWQLIF